jgi:tetratricopeptide (TPR) repeat protein/tRNA A-37 threonylcarbamoyl transferase component Bud32
MTDDRTPAAAADLDSLLGRVADDFLLRQERGERPDPEEYAARHPEAADLIRKALGSLRLVESAGDGPAPAGGPPVAGVLGDFRIGREVGRGGMGVVYEAEQLSLRRRVALKVLPFAAVMDPRSLQRFRNEALAAAGLDHPHVVKVHAVGQDRGVHYLAMQFVEGRSLADLIAERRGEAARPADPTAAPAATPPGSRTPADAAYLRRVAEWGAQAADALEHAHALGVVHRDVKPANLLVDGRGHLYVADFGLAQVAADPGLTATGDVLGTPRYMSPEQAAARHGLVDHRTDVYALGATLYELLTLAPAVPGESRAEVLRRVAEADPARPRSLDRRVPWDLETVVLKCLEKDPARRYPSAKELADDLRRWLAGDPIKARRPTARRRAWGWVRRSPARAALAATLVLGVAGLVGGVLWHNRELRAAADREAGLAREAVRQRDVARRAAEDMYTRVAQDWLADAPRLTDVQREFLEKARAIYEDLAGRPDTGPAARLDLARAYRRLGEIDSKLGRHEPAAAALDRAAALLEGEGPGDPGRTAELADIHRLKAGHLSARGRQEEAEAAGRRALALYAVVPPDAAGPEVRYGDASAYLNLSAILLRTERFADSEAAAREAAAILRPLAAEVPGEPRYHYLLGGCLNNLAHAALRRGDPAAARPLLEEAIGHQESALRLRPGFVGARVYLRNHYANLVMVLGRPADRPAAVAAARRALASAERLADDFPDRPGYQSLVADSALDLGNLLRAGGRAEDAAEAERMHRRAIGLLGPLADQAPAGHPDRGLLGAACGELAVMLADDPACPPDRAAEALTLAGRARGLLAADQTPWVALGVASYRAGDPAAAIDFLDRDGRRTTPALFYRAMALWRLGEREVARRQYEVAARGVADHPSPDPHAVRLRGEAAALLGITAAEVAPPPRPASR